MFIKVIRRASDVGRRTSDIVRQSSFVNRHSSVAVRYSSNGFSLIEILIALTIMIIALAPLMDSISGSFQSSRTGEEKTILVNYAREKMENVLAREFNTVHISATPGTPTALSDTVTVLGRTVNRDVFVELYDGNGDAAPDPDLKRITVVIEDIRQDTLLSYY